ncbi:4Fe-4S binding protein [Thermodesulfobacteriota bacterium]
MSFQRVTQAVSLGIFVGLLFLAYHPPWDGLAVDFFLRLDPLVAVGTMIADREFLGTLVPGLAVMFAAIFVGRLFCGHLCPMGTTIDALQIPLVGRIKQTARAGSYEATTKYRPLKYIFLGAIVSAAVGGVSLIFLGSPLSLITRLYALCFYPILVLMGEQGLALTGHWLADVGIRQLTFYQLPQKIFATNLFVALMFAGIIALSLSQNRFWCRNLCPAGGLMALFSRRPLVGRRVGSSCTSCGMCIRSCPMGAISDDPLKTAHSECIVCLKCRDICPEGAVSFGLPRRTEPASPSLANPGRRQVLLGIGSGLMAAGLIRTNVAQPRALAGESVLVNSTLIRPPGSLPEPRFLARCIRCGECMRACPTNTLQPVWLKGGIEGIFSPVMTPRVGACAVKCNLCGRVCPTGAVRRLPLAEKNHAKVGSAYILRRNCLAWEQDKKCLVCDEVCPYNAVSFRPVKGLRNAAPFVLENRCIGCGWCEARCPVQGAAAIRVNIIGQVRASTGSYIEKAKEYGYEFKGRDNVSDRLAPETFDSHDGFQVDAPTRKQSTPRDSGLPPGFILK